MTLFKQILAVLLCGLAIGAAASPAAPVAGAEYVVLIEPQPAEQGKKVEVIEFFAYYCPHCNVLEPSLAAWVKKQGDNIAFKRVHVSRGPSVLPQQMLFFTLETMGLLEKFHQKVFDAMHVDRISLRTDETVMAWVARNGIDKARFTEIYNGVEVAAKVRRTDAMMGNYRVDYWPMLFVDGKYMTSAHEASKNLEVPPPEAQQHANALMVMDFLVAKARSEKK